MANKTSIIITNSEGRVFELTNSKMAIDMAKNFSVNWDVVFDEKINPYDVIISDFHNPYYIIAGLGYFLVEHCDTKEEAEKIINECRDKLRSQYKRMMMIRVAKEYDLNPRLCS